MLNGVELEITGDIDFEGRGLFEVTILAFAFKQWEKLWKVSSWQVLVLRFEPGISRL
jgi:hypothetical protein